MTVPAAYSGSLPPDVAISRVRSFWLTMTLLPRVCGYVSSATAVSSFATVRLNSWMCGLAISPTPYCDTALDSKHRVPPFRDRKLLLCVDIHITSRLAEKFPESVDNRNWE